MGRTNTSHTHNNVKVEADAQVKFGSRLHMPRFWAYPAAACNLSMFLTVHFLYH